MISAARDKQVRSSFGSGEHFYRYYSSNARTLSRIAFPIGGLLDYHEFLSKTKKDVLWSQSQLIYGAFAY